MASFSIFGHDVGEVTQTRGAGSHGVYACIHLSRGSTSLLIRPQESEAWRALAGQIVAGCEYVEQAKRLGVVDIASLAPDLPPAA